MRAAGLQPCPPTSDLTQLGLVFLICKLDMIVRTYCGSSVSSAGEVLRMGLAHSKCAP